VAVRYEREIVSIGVSINRTKSIISDTSHRRAEFAKRIFYEGDEISPINFKILKEVQRSVYMLPELFRVMSLRGWIIRGGPCLSPPRFLSDKGKKLAFYLSLSPMGAFICPFSKGWYEPVPDVESVTEE
jgi:hypothetical protein